MQIHELNNFNGTPGATNFLAIDDGSDTSRISGEALLDPVNSRIDNLTANVLPDSVETILDWADVESASKTLTKNVSGFDYLDLYFKEVTSGTNRIVFAQRYPKTAFPAQVTIPVISWGGGTDPKYLYFQDLMIAISGTTLTMSQLRIYSWDGKAADGANIETGILVDQIRVDGVKISSNTSAELTDLRTAHNGTVYASARAAREADYNALDGKITPVANEVNNIRIGADGVTYASAGDAVRGQAQELADKIDPIIEAYTNLKPYLYAKNKYINASGVDTALNGYDTYKIPLDAFDVLQLSWDDVFWTGLNAGYIGTLEFADGTRSHDLNNKSYCSNISTGNDNTIFFGKIPNISNISAVYITAKRDLVSNVHVALNLPYVQYAFDKKNKKTVNANNTIQTNIYYNTSKVLNAFANPYFANWFKLDKGDTVSINKTITGVTGKGMVIHSDGTLETITNALYTATDDCLVEIYDNSTVDGDIIYTPKDEDKVDNQFDGLEGVAFGTSLTYRSISSYGFLTKLSELSGINFDNQGIGSSFILGNMLTAIKNYTGYAGKRVCTLEGFVNDWYGNKTLGNYTDTTETTVCGCVRSAINYIMSQNANITLFLILDHYGRNTGGVDCSTIATNGAGLTQFEYYEEISKVAESLGVPVIKEYAISQISENTPQYLLDNIHMNALGAEQSAYAIWSKMKEYFPNLI